MGERARYARIVIGRALMHLGLRVLPPGRARQELSAILWVWGMKVTATVVARRASGIEVVEGGDRD